ncbi:hypothetical protein NVV99_24310 [Rhodococcus sp. PAE-6]|uniref:hypothetical protein n=1 Tax=Rhodococcus sp. PAE-6 TaxID=2972477 RepID=UPI0021B3B826|nr:hypothetical protein [Rhodococcus sp. PAE-6]MCT7294025.1 hypothetical protein [Rhodococcus sp. PAE-6]
MNDEFARRVQKALREEIERLTYELNRGIDGEEATAAASNRLDLLQQYEHEVRWNNIDEVTDVAGTLGIG